MTVLGRAGCLSSLILGFGAALAAGCGGDSSTPPAPAPQPLVILHTNDLHSHLMGQSPEVDYTPAAIGAAQAAGGVARLATAIGAARAAAPSAASNMNFSPTDPGDDGLQQLATAGVIQTKLIKTAGTLKVGIFGLLGAVAASVTPQAAPLTFEAIASAATRMVADLRQNDKVDLVIALSHAGIYSDGTGEDAVLAQTVPGIDIIVSGHTHDALAQPTP